MKKLILGLLILLPFALVAQNMRTISGKVTASDGTSLPGASVFLDKNTIGEASNIKGIVKNFSIGTTTDIDGNFSLEIPNNTKELRCSFIGYKTIKINVAGKSVVNVVMSEDENLLDEVVVTGYQKIEKRKLTSAVSKVKTEEILQAGVASVDQMLDGQLAGVQTTAVSGAPGAPAKIRIRGTVSLDGTSEPLWVLDGIPLEGTDLPKMDDKDIGELLLGSSIANINPNDIEDITILKDAAATAIYGARAANGVIVITTKKGKSGKMNVNLRMNTSFVSKPNFDKLNLMNASEKVDFEMQMAKYEDLASDSNVKTGAIAKMLDESGLWDAYRAQGLSALPQDMQSRIAALKTKDTNWGDELYQTAINQEYGVSLSGGNDIATYYFSAGYYDEKGATVGTGLDRLNFTLKGDYKLRENLKVGVSMFSTNRKNESFLVNEGSYTSPSRYSRIANPYQEIYDEQGNFLYDTSLYPSKTIPFNVLEERQHTSYDKENKSLNTLFHLDWEIIPKLKFRTQFGLQKETTTREQYAHKNSFYARNVRESGRYYKNGEYVYYLPEGGVIKNWNTQQQQWTLKNILEYNLRFKEKHEFDFVAGTELRRNELTTIYSAGYGFNKETLTTVPVVFPDASRAFDLYKKNQVENAFVSFYGTMGYTFNNKYTFFGSMRVDGSDLFGADPKYRYQPLWAISGSWRVHEEEFLKDVDWLNSLKLRASYGLQGNIDKSASPFIIGAKTNVTILPGVNEIGILPENMPNDRLRWEKTKNINLGFDLSVLNDRLKVSADYYHRKSTDIIGARSIPLENGLPTTSLNWAALTNKGFEINLTTLNVATGNFRWSTSFNISKNDNTVDKIYEREDQTTPSLLGNAVNSIFVIKTAGLDKDGFMLFEKDGKKVTAKEAFGLYDPWGGGFWYQSSLTAKEKRELYSCIGTEDPDFSGGLINSFSYKNFSLDVSCSYNIGIWKKQPPFYSITNINRGHNQSQMMSQVWNPENKNGTYPRIIGSQTHIDGHNEDFFAYNGAVVDNLFQSLDIWYKKMNIFRVNSIRVGYNLPDSMLSKIGVRGAKLSLEARNPFVFGTNYDGSFDPETYGNIYAQPIPKSITVGLSVNF